jgi:ribosomal protein S18 acetylase RimI-like enzyme
MIQYLDWDSQFFGCRIGRVTSQKLTPSSLAQIGSLAKESRLDCLYFLAASNDDSTVQLAEHENFHLVDLRITLQISHLHSLELSKSNIAIDYASVADLPALRLIAAENHTLSRFFTDTHFAHQKCRELYAIWVEKAVRDPDTCVFTWRAGGEACAYVTAKICPEGSGEIDLVGIAPQYQGRGLGPQLIVQALRYFQQQKVDRVTTVTQGRNVHALKLYEKCGFSIASIELWYHKWFIHSEKR